MKKRMIKIISLVLCMLLLCSCSEKNATQQEKTFELPQLPENMHNVPEAYVIDQLNSGRIWFAGAYIELFNMLNPNTYVYYTSPVHSGDGKEVRISGPGCDELVNSGISSDYYNYKYKNEYFDLRRNDPIPRKPKTEVSFEDGVTMSVLHDVYPARSEYTKCITYTLEATEHTEYEKGRSLYKYVDGEWLSIISMSYAEFAVNALEKDKPKNFIITASEYLGEGLYRIEHDGKYYAEFVVRENGKTPKMTECDFKNCYRANVFCRVGLPVNCHISARGTVNWPYFDRSYTKMTDGLLQEGVLSQWFAIIRENGIESLNKFLVPNDDLQEVISPYEAAEIVLPELMKIEEEIIVTNVEYVLTWPEQTKDTLHPTWRFTVEKGAEKIYFLVEARTGELL